MTHLVVSCYSAVKTSPMIGRDFDWERLVSALRAATTSDDVAALVLRAAASRATAALDASEWTTRGVVVRSVVHLRTGIGYRRLIGIEHPSGRMVEDLDCATLAIAWRWIVEQRCAVSIDVQRGAVVPWLGTSRSITARATTPVHSMHDSATRDNLLRREVTHVHVVPVCGVGGAPAGMLAIEARCREAIGCDFVWPDISNWLATLATISAPHLLELPSRSVPPPAPDELLPVIGSAMAPVVELLRLFSAQDETMLLGGQTGVGKSRLARWVHAHSPRCQEPFEIIDLMSIPEELQMGELFGWRRGAFTGAVRDNPGAIARAGRGTLFLDEIGNLSLRAQAGLLRVLEEHTYRPMGDNDSRDQPARARFIVGSNADLGAAVREGRFREDLYYRINVLPIRVPPLSERRDEVPLWADYMVARRHRHAGAPGRAVLTADAGAVLQAHEWPGNLRQLDNVMRRAYTLALADRGACSDVTVQGPHAERALLADAQFGPQTAAPLVAELWRAANAFVTEAQTRRRNDKMLSLDLADSFRGMILAAATQRFLDHHRMLDALGQEHLLKDRNHHRLLRRELDRVRELVRVLDSAEVPPDLAALLGDTRAPASRSDGAGALAGRAVAP